MNNMGLLNLTILGLSSLAIFIVGLLLFFTLRINRKFSINAKLDQLYLKIKNDINFAVGPKFINLSPVAEDLFLLAVEVWRIEQRLLKLKVISPEIQNQGIVNSLQKIKRYFEKNDIEIVDYTDQKFNEGLNIDILSVEKDSNVNEPTVKETVEPSVLYKGQVVRKAKIILVTKQD